MILPSGKFAVLKTYTNKSTQKNDYCREVPFLYYLYKKCIQCVQIIQEEIPAKYGNFAFLMEYLGAEDGWYTMLDVIRKRHLLVNQALLGQMCISLIEGVMLLHSHGIIHSDIKPENVMVNIRTGQAKILDFGMACFRRRPNVNIIPNRCRGIRFPMCDPMYIGGTPQYMHQAWVKIIGNRLQPTGRQLSDGFDNFAVLVTLYEFLRGTDTTGRYAEVINRLSRDLELSYDANRIPSLSTLKSYF